MKKVLKGILVALAVFVVISLIAGINATKDIDTGAEANKNTSAAVENEDNNKNKDADVDKESEESDTDEKDNEEKDNEEKEEESKEEEKEDFTKGPIIIKNNMGIVTIEGTITNNTDKAYNLMIKVNLGNSDGDIIASGLGAVPVILPGETKAYKTITTDDVSAVTNYRVKISSATKAYNVDLYKNVEFGDITCRNEMGILTASGTVKNTDDATHSYILSILFYDKDGNFIGTADGAVNGVNAGETDSYKALGTFEVPEDVTVKVQVDSGY